MQLQKQALVTILSLAVALPAVARTNIRRGPTSPTKTSSASSTRASAKPSTSKTITSKTTSKGHAKKTTATKKLIGPRSMDDERATQIQSALIKNGYLNGEPTGHWDTQSQAAMQKMQADNGWQTKLIPDSRALIKLGLGPNSNTASNSTPQPLPAQ